MSVTIPADPAHWAELVTTALLGTDRRMPEDLADADPTTAVLRQAARHRVVALLGATTAVEPELSPTTAPTAETAPVQDRPDAPPAADRLLGELLRTPDPALVSCWLTACAAHGHAIHPIHWTRLARFAARTTAYDRVALGTALGPRGRWFLRQNPEWRRLAADSEQAPNPEPLPTSASPPTLTAQDVLLDPEAIFTAPRPWGPELVSAAYAVLGGEGHVPPARTYPTRLGVELPTALYPSIAKAGEYYLLAPDASPARRRTIRDRFVALELAAYARAAIDHAFTSGTDNDPDHTGFTRAEIPHV
ncbi:MAG: hypothetical protein QM650_19015 [Microlunatus sp.]